MNSSIKPRVVLKFGGSSVSSLDKWETIAGLVGDRLTKGERLLIVHSALKGVTDNLELLPVEAAAGRHAPLLEELIARHLDLCEEMGLDGRSLLEADFEKLSLAVEGIALVQEVNPRIRARILAFGEHLSTRIGAAFLASRELPVKWLDARDLLAAVDTGRQSGSAVWLSAECEAELDTEVRDRLDALPGPGLTQGFTARGLDGDTVVLGRGGSDTAAAYLAGKWGADRIEIWSDVSGMFTADPRVVPTARLLRRLDYREAQEIATTGSQVLHPRAVRALRDREIPIHLRSTVDPSAPGTVIEATGTEGPAQVKAISRKRKVVLVSMETLGMWQEVGFLARAFRVFEEAGVSVDLVSTSETNVTVSLDSGAALLDDEILGKLHENLSSFCGVQFIRPCAAVSLVGNRIRALLHRMGPALEAFEEHRVHLVSQAASDLNLTVVVDEAQADDLLRALHELLIPAAGLAGEADSEVFGASWEALAGSAAMASSSGDAG